MFIEEIERLERKEIFLQKAILKHQNKFDYSKVDYFNSITLVIFICNKHKIEFSQTPVKHLQNKHITLIEFIDFTQAYREAQQAYLELQETYEHTYEELQYIVGKDF